MPSASVLIACVGAAAAVVGGAVALFNARKAVLWKRAELANSYLKDLSTSPELVFACRALDWNGGKLVVPEGLRPLLPEGTNVITHDREALIRAMKPDLKIHELSQDARLQLYRTALDSLLSWLSFIQGALARDLFAPEDVREVGYWVQRIHSSEFLQGFIEAYLYEEHLQYLHACFSAIGVDAPKPGSRLASNQKSPEPAADFSAAP